jgi:general secretion pathway protein I
MPAGKSRGFTLIEVMVALVIVSIGMVAVIQAVSQAASNGSYLRDKSIAQWVALNQLTLMRIAQSPPTKGGLSGETEMAGQRWRWKAEVIDTAVVSMKRIDIAVSAADTDENSQLVTVTGFYGERIGKPGVQIVQFTPGPPSLSGDNPNGTPRGSNPTPEIPTPGTPTNPQPSTPLLSPQSQ